MALSSAGSSTMMHSDVVMRELTDAASTRAVRTTFNGSMMPARAHASTHIEVPNTPLAALQSPRCRSQRCA